MREVLQGYFEGGEVLCEDEEVLRIKWGRSGGNLRSIKGKLSNIPFHSLP